MKGPLRERPDMSLFFTASTVHNQDKAGIIRGGDFYICVDDFRQNKKGKHQQEIIMIKSSTKPICAARLTKQKKQQDLNKFAQHSRERDLEQTCFAPHRDPNGSYWKSGHYRWLLTVRTVAPDYVPNYYE